MDPYDAILDFMPLRSRHEQAEDHPHDHVSMINLGLLHMAMSVEMRPFYPHGAAAHYDLGVKALAAGAMFTQDQDDELFDEAVKLYDEVVTHGYERLRAVEDHPEHRNDDDDPVLMDFPLLADSSDTTVPLSERQQHAAFALELTTKLMNDPERVRDFPLRMDTQQ